MDDTDSAARDHVISVQLDVDLGREPVRGRLRCGAADEPFVGWLGFVEALRRLAEPAPRPPTDRPADRPAGPAGPGCRRPPTPDPTT